MLTNTVTGNASGRRESAPGSVGPKAEEDAASAAVRGAGATAAGSAPAAATGESIEASHRSASYMLNGRDSELKNYIDHRVEVTGTLEEHFDELGDTDSIPPSGSPTTHGRNTALQWLRVASVKTISSDCSAK